MMAMLGQRLRRRPNIKSLLVQCVVSASSAGHIQNTMLGCERSIIVRRPGQPTFVQCWTKVKDVEVMLYKCYTNIFVFAGLALLG